MSVQIEDKTAVASPPPQPSSTAARATGIAYTITEDSPVNQFTDPIVAKTAAMISLRKIGFAVSLSTSVPKASVV
jgi:hypothetical protein